MRIAPSTFSALLAISGSNPRMLIIRSWALYWFLAQPTCSLAELMGPQEPASATRYPVGRSLPGDVLAILRHSRDGSRAPRPHAHSANAPTRSRRGRLRRQ